MVAKYYDQALESFCVVKLCTSLVYLLQGTDQYCYYLPLMYSNSMPCLHIDCLYAPLW
jgi:hypothetical protein